MLNFIARVRPALISSPQKMLFTRFLHRYYFFMEPKIKKKKKKDLNPSFGALMAQW